MPLAVAIEFDFVKNGPDIFLRSVGWSAARARWDADDLITFDAFAGDARFEAGPGAGGALRTSLAASIAAEPEGVVLVCDRAALGLFRLCCGGRLDGGWARRPAPRRPGAEPPSLSPSPSRSSVRFGGYCGGER
jgi:hypothetical protein